jgi:hypothetical protein
MCLRQEAVSMCFDNHNRCSLAYVLFTRLVFCLGKDERCSLHGRFLVSCVGNMGVSEEGSEDMCVATI